jgi:ribose 5-phosphate isomerase A
VLNVQSGVRILVLTEPGSRNRWADFEEFTASGSCTLVSIPASSSHVPPSLEVLIREARGMLESRDVDAVVAFSEAGNSFAITANKESTMPVAPVASLAQMEFVEREEIRFLDLPLHLTDDSVKSIIADLAFIASGKKTYFPPDFQQFENESITNLERKRGVAQLLANRVEDGTVVGAGSGTTSYLAIQEIAGRMRRGELKDVTLIPTSLEVEFTCTQLGIPTASISTARPVWAFDGADEVDKDGDLIKGRGGALLREKIVFASTGHRIVIVDESKMVVDLNRKFPIPVEVIPDALPHVNAALREVGAWSRKLRMATPGKDGPVLTEAGNLLLDCFFQEVTSGLELAIKGVVGVVESGLFQGFQPEVLIT